MSTLSATDSPDLERPQPRPFGAQPRLIGAVVMLVGAAWLGVGVWLSPDYRGLGTHQQLGLSACGLHERYGVPCPTCGMTTAFTLATQGRLLQAMSVQFAGALLALAVAMATLAGAWSLVTGASLAPAANALAQARTWWVLGGLTLAAWLVKLVG
ncbi:MAG: DUF2752 domain-containing protein [Planctomycetota bacterium]